MNEEKEKRLTENADLAAPTKVQEEKTDSENVQDDDNKKTGEKVVSGYALKFNEPSKDLGGFVEVITPEALKNTDLSDVCLLIGHDFTQILGRTKADTLKLEVDEIGLKFEATLPDTSYANDIYANITAGNVDSMSFGMMLGEEADEFTKDDDGKVIRTIKNIQSLFDVSIVTIPAYEATDLQVNTRSFDLYKKTQTQKEETNMTKKLLTTQETATRSFENFIRSQGQIRDGLTTINADVVIPKEVIGEVFDLKRQSYNLAQYATVKEVSNGQGKYPIATNQNEATLATKEELAMIADVDAEMFTPVEYNVATRAGKIALSNEVVEDSVVNIVEEVKSQLEQLVVNTDNQNIMAKLKAFTKVAATGLDDIKKVNNVTLDPALNKTAIVNQDTFNYLDTLKDNDGRYILQPDVTAASGYSLFGNPVVVVSNKLFASPAGKYPMVIGDIAQAIFVARRNQVTTQWEKFDYYSQGLAVIVRNDYQVIDAEAARYVEITPTPAG